MHMKAIEPRKKNSTFICTCLSLHSNYLNVCHDSEPFHIKEDLDLLPRSVMRMHCKLSFVKHFIVQLMHTNCKILRSFKYKVVQI